MENLSEFNTKFEFYKFDVPEFAKNTKLLNTLDSLSKSKRIVGKYLAFDKYPGTIGRNHTFWLKVFQKNVDETGKEYVQIVFDHLVKRSRVDTIAVYIDQDPACSDDSKFSFIYAKGNIDTNPKIQMLAMTENLWGLDSIDMNWNWFDSQVEKIAKKYLGSGGRRSRRRR